MSEFYIMFSQGCAQLKGSQHTSNNQVMIIYKMALFTSFQNDVVLGSGLSPAGSQLTSLARHNTHLNASMFDLCHVY